MKQLSPFDLSVVRNAVAGRATIPGVAAFLHMSERSFHRSKTTNPALAKAVSEGLKAREMRCPTCGKLKEQSH